MFIRGLSKQAQNNLESLKNIPFVKNYYLAGGTGLSLHFGHRFSYDLDFFSQNPVRPEIIRKGLSDLGKVEVFQNNEGTFNGVLNGVKLSFFIYPYGLLEKAEEFNGTFVAGVSDISAMKIDAISSRGTKRDFIDLYFICHKFKPLEELFPLFERKYSGVKFNMLHIIKSLVYFVDAEDQEMPEMIEKVNWEDVKKFFEKEVVRLGRKYL